MRVYLVRHTAVNVEEGVCYGRSDVPLADSFEAEYVKLRAKLPETIGLVYCSPLVRCRTIAERLSTQVTADGRLREYDFGAWEMKKWDDISGAVADAWFGDYVNVRPPEGESFVEMKGRVTSFWHEKILPTRHSGDIYIISHAGVIRCVLAEVLGIPLEKVVNVSIGLGSVAVLRVEEGFVQVEGVNG